MRAHLVVEVERLSEWRGLMFQMREFSPASRDIEGEAYQHDQQQAWDGGVPNYIHAQSPIQSRVSYNITEKIIRKFLWFFSRLSQALVQQMVQGME